MAFLDPPSNLRGGVGYRRSGRKAISRPLRGLWAVLRFSAFNMRTTPEVIGKVSWISPDITKDERTDASYYTLRIAVSEEELKRLKGLKVVPGMPVEAFIQTEYRTALSYFLKPLTDQVTRTFRDG